MNKINIYNCGPTLADYTHIGCYRIFVLSDILDKHFNDKGYEVNHGINIMDIDDVILDKLNNHEFDTKVYYDSLKKEFKLLNINYPNKETVTTKDYKLVQEVIDNLIKKDKAYITNTGIYLDLSKIDNYGTLSHINVDKTINTITKLDKKNSYDPSLWKFKDGEKFSVEFHNKLGRPGWDIQCAACSIFKLDSDVDYQICGFNDHTHYENEKVIIENYSEKRKKSKWILVKYINFTDETPYFYLKDYLEAGYSRQVLKYALYSIKYSTNFNFDLEHLKSSEKNINKINNFYNKLLENDCNDIEDSKEIIAVLNKFQNINDLIEELNVPIIFGNLFKLIKLSYKFNFEFSNKVKEEIKEIIIFLNKRFDFLIEEESV